VISTHSHRYQHHNNRVFVEDYKNAEVYIGQNPKSSSYNILFMNNDSNFGWHSIYETGEIINNKKSFNGNIYDSLFCNVYENSYLGYYDYS
jgi:hypothetical protein